MGKDDTRQHIIETAVGLLSERWYSVVSVADICRKAGVSNGLFYAYYRNKEALIRELLERFLGVLEESVTDLDRGTIRQRRSKPSFAPSSRSRTSTASC